MIFRLTFACLVLALAGCATTPAERIEKNRAAYDSWPPDVQARVRAGEVAIGFTTEQVHMALGDPDRVVTIAATNGTEEVWAYRNHRPQFTLGFGMGGGNGSGYAGGGATVSSQGAYPGEVLRVTFAGGRAVVVEKLR